MLPVSLHLATVLIHGTHAFQSYQVTLINKTKKAQQLRGNGRGSMALLAQWLSCETLYLGNVHTEALKMIIMFRSLSLLHLPHTSWDIKA